MIVSNKISLKKLYFFTKENLWFLIATSLMALITVPFIDETAFKGLSYPAGFMGTALAILIGFRNNSAYSRWWKARQIWDGLVSDSRHFGLMIIGFLSKDEKITTANLRQKQKAIIYRHIAFVWALNKHLRKLQWEENILPFISEQELEALKKQDHIPLALLKLQAIELQRLNKEQLISNLAHIQFDRVFKDFNEAISSCEGIKNTVFPMQYNWFVQYAIWVFLLIFPFSIAGFLGYWSFPFSVLIGYVFIMLEYVGFHIENPFENGVNDTPLDNLARTIEINLKEIIDEKELPPVILPKEGKYLF